MKRWRICIDPGHGGNASGSLGHSGTREADVNLAVAKELVIQLELLSISGYLTRHCDSTLSLSDRVAIGEGSDGFISIHCNSFHDYRIHGVETLFPSPGGKSKSLANYLQQSIVGGHRDRGIKMSPSKSFKDTLYVLRMNSVPAALLELEFISNPTWEKWLVSEETHKNIAYNLAKGVSSWVRSLGGELPEPKKARRKRKSGLKVS